MKPGMSLAQRNVLRERYRHAAIAQAASRGLTERCRIATLGLSEPSAHQMCRGEMPGNSGCLCLCHDNPGVEIVSREDRDAVAEDGR
jgi:hypothetical protein